MNAQKVSEVINNIVGTYGIDILADSKRFNALFDDFAPELDEERRIFHRVINEEILNSFFMIKNLSETEQKNELLKIDKRIREFMGFSSSWSYFVIDSFSLAFNCENPLTFDECNESVDNFSSGSEDGLDLFKVNRAICKKIAVGPYHALGVTESGQVIAVGFNGNGQCEVSGWNNIVEVSTDAFHSVGLKNDGTVVATPIKNETRFNVGQDDVSSWRRIVSVAAGTAHTIGLRDDGTVVAVGENRVGQCNVADWKDIVAIDASGRLSVGLKKDGTVLVAGGNSFGQCNIESWSDVVAITVTGMQVMGLKKDGTLLTTICSGDRDHGQCNVAQWTDIIAVSTSAYVTVGIKKDGSVVATKYYGDPKYDYGQTDVSKFNDIIAVAASSNFSIGLKKDGTLVMSGNNKYGQDRVLSWKLFNSLENYMKKNIVLKKDDHIDNEVSRKQPSNDNRDARIKELTEEIKRLTAEKASLGIFSGKRKKEIDERIQVLQEQIRQISCNVSDNASFKMIVQDMFTMKERGTVLVSQIEHGKLNINDTLIVNGKHGVVTGIECNRKLLKSAGKEDGTLGVLVRNIALSDVRQGDVVYK